MRFCEMNAREIAAGVREKKFSAAEVFEDCLSRAEKHEDKLHALITVAAEAGRAQAKRVDEMTAKGESPGLLAGVPVVLKDNICSHGIRTTGGSRVLGDWAPPYDATVWSLLAGQGAVLLGKSNMDEFGAGTVSKSALGQTANPWDTSRIPGGSSGGSAAAVAAGYAPLALGSDTGGSVRLPASYCGIYGFKPSYGLVSRSGLLSYCSSFDHIGPFTRDMGDMELAMRVLACHDPKDSTSVKSGVSFSKHTHTLKGRRIAIVKELGDTFPDQPVAGAMRDTVRLFEEAGAEVVEISLPTVARYALACYYTIVASESFTALARFDGVRYGRAAEAAGVRDMFEAVRSQGFGVNVKHRILAGTCLAEPKLFEEYYSAAVRVRTLIAAEFSKAFESGGCKSEKIDCILQPVSPSLPGKIGQDADQEHENKLDLCALPANIAGLPGLAFRAAFAKEAGLPVGLQLVGPRWSDGELLDIGFELEKILGAPHAAPESVR